MNYITQLDVEILKFFSLNFNNVIIDKIMVSLTYLGNLGLIWIIISLVLILNRKYRKIGILTLAALLLNLILGEGIIKHIVKRPRPFMEITAFKILISKPHSYSFPSGHTASAFAAAVTIFKNNKKIGKYALILACLIAFSRVYLLVHYPSDVIGGIILGVISAYIVNKLSIIKLKNI